MPGLKNLIKTLPATNQSEISIRVLCIECIGYMMSAVHGEEGFLSD
jgi:hypothetical protein